MQRRNGTTRARRAGLAVVGLTLVAACGLQRTGVQGTVAAGRLTVDEGSSSQVTTSDPAAAGQTPGAATDTGPGATADPGASGTVDPGSGTVVAPAPGGGATTTAGGTSKASPTKGGSKATSGLSGGSKASATKAATGGSKLTGTLVVSLTHVGGFSELAKGIPGINIAEEGNQANSDALMSWFNAHGGIAGKQLVTKYHDYNAQQASPENEQSYCTTVKGDGAFAAVIGGQIQPATRQCYSAAKILTFEGSTYGMPSTVFTQNDPYYWAMSYPTYEQEEKAKISSLCARKWFGGGSAVGALTKVGVALWNDPIYTDLFDKVTKPALMACGFTAANIDEEKVSDTDIQSIEAGLNTAGTNFQANRATHVMFIGSAPLQPFFIQQEQHQGFVYGESSFDNPSYEQYNEPGEMAGSMGIGFNIDEDTDDANVPFPQPGIEKTCYDIYKAEGITLTNRYSGSYNAKEAIQWCQTLVWLKKVADEVGPSVSTKSWSARAESDGAPFTAAFSWGSSVASGHHAWTTAYRDWAFDSGCTCGKYTGAVTTFS